MLIATNIHKSFGDRNVLKGVDISINPGEIACLIGPSGSGKTTLLRALALLDLPDQGEIRLDENTYRFPLGGDDTITPPWPKLTVVFQSLFLWPHLTLRENILLPARNVNPRVEAEIEEKIEYFDMGHFIDNYPNQASLGQRQRVALVRAIMLKPQIILLDEITSSLDVEQIQKVLELLTLVRDEGIGIFLITHLINFARNASDKILFLDGGKIVESGSPKILKKPQTARLREFMSVIEAAS